MSHGQSFVLDRGEVFVKPCCWYRGRSKLTQTPTPELQPWYTIDSWTQGCSVCKEQEDAGYNSFRQVSFDVIPNTNNPAPVAIDINIDFSCNSACITCGPHFSTLWQAQLDSSAQQLDRRHYQYQGHLQDILSNVDFGGVRRLKFFGGEPLLTQSHMDVLEKVSNPELVELWYTTNASILPKKEVFDMWAKFKLVFLEFSLDGIEDQFNYIRWPLTWQQVTATMFKIRDQAPSNVLFRINHTLNPFNVYYFDRLEQWVNDNFSINREQDPVEINIHPCWGVFGFDKTPENLRNVIYEKYKNQAPANLLKTTQQNNDLSELQNFISRWEPVRHNSWSTTFPDIVEYFNF